MEDDVVKIMEKFNLNEADCVPINISEQFKSDDLEDTKWSLIGELITMKKYNRNAFKKAMLQAWNCKETVRFTELEENIFQIVFSSSRMMPFVLNQGPWLFEDHLFNLYKWEKNLSYMSKLSGLCQFWIQLHGLPYDCRGKSVAKMIGGQVGKVVKEEGDFLSDGVSQRRFVRLKIEFNVKNPLVRGICIQNEGVKSWIWIRYERLPKFCSYCGIIGHESSGCLSRMEAENKGEAINDNLYGPWLKTMHPNLFSLQSKQNKNVMFSPVSFPGRRNSASTVVLSPVMVEIGLDTQNVEQLHAISTDNDRVDAELFLNL